MGREGDGRDLIALDTVRHAQAIDTTIADNDVTANHHLC